MKKTFHLLLKTVLQIRLELGVYYAGSLVFQFPNRDVLDFVRGKFSLQGKICRRKKKLKLSKEFLLPNVFHTDPLSKL